MGNRLTMVLCFDENSNKKIEEFVKNNGGKNFCKVPYNTDDREKNDTLPYHITLSSYNLEKFDDIKEMFNKLQFENYELEFTPDVWDFSLKSLNGKILFLRPIDDNKIKSLEAQIYKILPSEKEKFIPKNFHPHCTLNIDCDTENIETFYRKTKDTVLKLKIDSIGLFEIYPAKLLSKLVEK